MRTRYRLKRWLSLVATLSLTFSLMFFYNNCGGAPEAEENSGPAELTSDAFSGVIQSSLNQVDNQGNVVGYAYDPKNKDFALRIHFYVDGPVGSGVNVGSAVANQTGLGASSGHFFSFKVPAQYRDALPHSLYVYGHTPDPQNTLSGAPTSFRVYEPKAQNTFNTKVAGPLNACNSCHSWTYTAAFYGPLMRPAPHAGGSATNNVFLNKINGSSGHGGGSFCTNASDPCKSIIEWWNAEFN